MRTKRLFFVIFHWFSMDFITVFDPCKISRFGYGSGLCSSHPFTWKMKSSVALCQYSHKLSIWGSLKLNKNYFQMSSEWNIHFMSSCIVLSTHCLVEHPEILKRQYLVTSKESSKYFLQALCADFMEKVSNTDPFRAHRKKGSVQYILKLTW